MKKVIVPKSHREISIPQFEKVMEIYLNNFEFEIERHIQLTEVLTSLTRDEIEEMDLGDLKKLIEQINKIDVTTNSDKIVGEITVSDILFGASTKKEFSVKETMLLQKIFIAKKPGYLSELAAVFYHPIIEGEIKKDYSVEAIQSRKELFANLNMEIIFPLVTKLTKFLTLKNNV